MVTISQNMLIAPCGANPPINQVARVVRVEPQKNRLWLSFPELKRIPKPFDETKRAALMREQASIAGVNLSTIYRYVERYYSGGSTKLAMVPRYRSVTPGDNQPEGQKRRGRPPREKPPEGETAFIFTKRRSPARLRRAS